MTDPQDDTPMFICGPTTGCGKAMRPIPTYLGWVVPKKCPHCGAPQVRGTPLSYANTPERTPEQPTPRSET